MLAAGLFSKSSNSYSGFATKRSPSMVSSLLIVAFIACSDWSIPIHFLPFVWADFKVVPEPQKQSSTILFSSEEVLIIKSNKSGFFSVGYVGY